MKCIMVHIHQYLKIILLSLITFPVLAQDSSPTEPIARGMIISSCVSLESITQLANLDKQSEEEFTVFLTQAFTNASNILKLGASFYIWHSDSKGLLFRLAGERIVPNTPF